MHRITIDHDIIIQKEEDGLISVESYAYETKLKFHEIQIDTLIQELKRFRKDLKETK